MTYKAKVTSKGFLKLNRGSEYLEALLEHPNEWLLLTIIALRARRTDCKIRNLKECQALVGDYKKYGMTRQQYRTAIGNLQDWSLITTQTTNKGTIATLCSKEIWDINAETNQPTSQPNNNQPTNQTVTTNKKDKKERSKDITDIIDYLNRKAGTAYKTNTKVTVDKITARLNEGFTVNDFRTVIDKKIAEWQHTDYVKYIRPETLFGNKFESYLNQSNIKANQNIDLFANFKKGDK